MDNEALMPQTLTMKLQILESTVSVCRLDAKAAIPDWALHSNFLSITRTTSELSIVCETGRVPHDIQMEQGWKIFKVEGILDFSLTGILASIANPLAQAKISIFAISTFDTDYILVKEENLDQAVEVLSISGFEILK